MKLVFPSQVRPPVAAPAPQRRRVLRLLAASSLVGLAALRPGTADAATGRKTTAVSWRGRVMGAEAALALRHTDREAAEQALAGALTEIDRLESIFSLYRSNSTLRRLNMSSALAEAPRDMLDLLALCRRVHVASGGAFDPTVQPLWELYADHFSTFNPDEGGPPARRIDAALERVGLDKLRIAGRRLDFERSGMALSLNGIAQGWITDRVRDWLAGAGFAHSLIDLGEYRALGTHPDGRGWRIGIAAPTAPWRIVETLALPAGCALATSAAAGAPFVRSLRHHHLFDPMSGHSAHGFASVSVLASTAALADGLSTALAVASPDRAQDILARFPEAGALLVDAEGGKTRINLSAG